MPILPGQTIGILGSGQLGRMLAIAARQMGYRVVCYSPDLLSPTGPLCDDVFMDAYDDTSSLQSFARQVNVVTLEFENIPVSALETLAQHVPVFPQPHVLFHTQHRLREKEFLSAHNIPVAGFCEINTQADLARAVTELGIPAVLKTAGFGYDGKGQIKIEDASQVDAAWDAINGQEAVLEQWVPFTAECAMMVARDWSGNIVCYPLTETYQANHILDWSLTPARLPAELEAQAQKIARTIAEALDLVGILAVEFFVGPDGGLLVNELAPRPHNSGHWTLEGTLCSQFEQQLRAVCGLPLGDVSLRQPTAVGNLLGNLWANGIPHWASILSQPDVRLHLYGKNEARPGRKMGHVSAIGNDADMALTRLLEVRKTL